MPIQLTMPVVRRAVRADIHRYCQVNGARYRRFAERITPDVAQPDAIYTRVAFAILSANAPFERTVDSLAYCHDTHWRPDPFVLASQGMVPAKARYITAMAARSSLEYLRRAEETWDAYRGRLQATTPGLGMAKASFAACLVYPLTADLACVDTWIQRVVLGTVGFQKISAARYRRIEAWVRRIARRHGLPTFVTQWLIWDHARGVVSDHAIFPMTHKGTEALVK
jgi:thermostable 8-oxoguanine DNA glycosylase